MMAQPPTNEELVTDPRLQLALHFAVMDTIMRLQIAVVPPSLVADVVNTTIAAMSDVEGMAASLDAVRYMSGSR